MCIPSAVFLNRVGLIMGFAGTLLLAFSQKIGVISKGGEIIFTGMDSMDPVENKIKRVKESHWRNRKLMPVGWLMLAVSFLIQLAATSL